MNTPLPRSDILRLALAGGLAFWTANLAISLTPIAAEYRRALSIPYLPMLVEAMAGGLVIGAVVAFVLTLLPGAASTRHPIRMALAVSFAALIVVTVSVEVPAKLALTADDPFHWLIVGAAFNLVRFFALGLTIGLLIRRLGHLPATRSVQGSVPLS